MTDDGTLGDIVSRLNAVFQDVFDDDELHIHNAMTADEVEDWDSLAHVALVVATEKEFDIRLNASEIAKLQNVGEMIQTVARYLSEG